MRTLRRPHRPPPDKLSLVLGADNAATLHGVSQGCSSGARTVEGKPCPTECNSLTFERIDCLLQAGAARCSRCVKACRRACCAALPTPTHSAKSGWCHTSAQCTTASPSRSAAAARGGASATTSAAQSGAFKCMSEGIYRKDNDRSPRGHSEGGLGGCERLYRSLKMGVPLVSVEHRQGSSSASLHSTVDCVGRAEG